MSHGVPFFIWRGGRPRWNPSPRLRRLGFRGKDLKGEDGAWLPLVEAIEAARAINSELPSGAARARPPIERRPAANKKGFVYFCLCGEHIKIGFSTRPLSRISAISGSHPAPMEILVVVPGTFGDEQRLHAVFSDFRLGGEWFEACRQILNLMTRCVHARRVVYGRTTPNLIINKG